MVSAKRHLRHDHVVVRLRDLTRFQWSLLKARLHIASQLGTKCRDDGRYFVDATLYISYTGCQ